MEKTDVIWVAGANGFVGGEIADRFEKAGYENVVRTDDELSVTEQERLESFAEQLQPAVVVNCAGIRREATGLSNRIKAYEVNALGAKNMAVAANTVGATIVQVSSDDVYSSKLNEPVNEFDSPEPDSPYGKSKRAGEMMVRNITENHLILRSSWLYRAQSGRFQEILEAARTGARYEARTDQFAAPTSVSLYVDLMIRSLERGVRGTYHLITRGSTSRFGFAEEILRLAGFDPTKILVPATDKKTAENVILEGMMLEIEGIQLPTWQDDLSAYMKEEGLLAH